MKGWSLDGFIIGSFFGLLGFLIGATFEGTGFPWEALAAIGTLAAVAVALFLPVWHRKQRLKNIALLIQSEIKKNNRMVEKAVAFYDPSHEIFKQGLKDVPPCWSLAGAFVCEISFDHWDRHWAEYSLLDAKQYMKDHEQMKALYNLKSQAEKAPECEPSRVFFNLAMEQRYRNKESQQET